jgi:hypothetical protein
MKLAERLRQLSGAIVDSWADLPPMDCERRAHDFYTAAVLNCAADEIERSGKAQRAVSDADIKAVIAALYQGEG